MERWGKGGGEGHLHCVGSCMATGVSGITRALPSFYLPLVFHLILPPHPPGAVYLFPNLIIISYTLYLTC
jgi:hypothetical protein